MLARQPTFSFPDFATTFRERKRLLSRSFVLFISPAHFQNFNCIIYSIKMMFQTKAVLYFLLCLNAVALFDVVDDCRDAAKEGTRQCQVWASNGECDKNPEFMHDQCQLSCGLCTPADCLDLAEAGTRQCREWAWHGECETNQEYMANYCRKSCGLCEPGSIEEMLFCEDTFVEQCSKWAEDDRCIGTWTAKKGQHEINSAYVVEFCPKSCKVCDIHLDDRDFSLNLGLPQSAPDISDKQIKNRIKAQVATIRDYVQTLEPELQEVCKMAHPFCARFSLSTDCDDHAGDDMIKYMCAASCQTCELLRGDKEGMHKARAYYAQAILEHEQSKAK